MRSRLPPVLAVLCAFLLICTSAVAQQPTDAPAQPPAATPPATAAPLVETDQMVVNTPTTMPLKRHKSYFRITHRFARDLRRGSFGELAEDLFSIDNGAIIGLEYRFAFTDRIQAGINRSILGKTIDIFGRWDVLRQSDAKPFGLSPAASIEGQDNLTLDPQPGLAATFSRLQGSWLAAYATPTFVWDAHTPTLQASHGDHTHDDGTGVGVEEEPGEDEDHTAYIGLGARARILETVSLVAEVSPRIWGYRPGRAAWNVGIEKVTRGHVMQLNFGNTFGTTRGQIARGGSDHDVYLGFNLSRKW